MAEELTSQAEKPFDTTVGEEDKETPVFTLLYELDDAAKEEIRSQFQNRLRTAEEYMKTLYPSMIANYKKYCSVADPIKDEEGNIRDDRSNLFIPYPYAIVESELPRLAGRLPRARAFPKKDIDKQKVEAIQDLLYYSLDRMNFIEIQTLWMRQYEIYGWSPLYYYWRKEDRNVLERVPQNLPDGSQAFVLQRTNKTVFDDFWSTVLDVFDCFFQPGVERIEEGDWFFFREWYSAKDLRRMVKAGILYPEVAQYLDDNSGPSYRVNQGEGRAQRDDIKKLSSNYSTDYSYGKFELMWMLERERVVLVLDRKIVARVGDNPNPLQEIPIINCNLAPLVNEPIGVGAIESLAGLPDKLNALTNARLDDIALLLGMIFLVNRNDQQIDVKNLRASAGNVIPVGDINNSIKALQIPDVVQSSESDVRMTKEDMQFVSGVSDYIVGTKTSSKLVDTATGVSTVVRESNAKFALKLSTFECGSLRKFIHVDHVYNMTYMPEKKRIHVAGPNGIRVRDVTLDDILNECDFTIEPGSCVPLDQLSRREALMNLLDRVMRLPTIIRVDKYMREVLESFDIRNVEELLVQPDGVLNAAEDVRTAEGENIALSQGDDVPLVGNDGLHLGIHQSVDTNSWSGQAIEKMQSHIQQHQTRIQQEMQQQTGGPNGGLPNPAGPSQATQVPGPGGNMGGATGIPGLPGAGAPAPAAAA